MNTARLSFVQVEVARYTPSPSKNEFDDADSRMFGVDIVITEAGEGKNSPYTLRPGLLLFLIQALTSFPFSCLLMMRYWELAQ